MVAHWQSTRLRMQQSRVRIPGIPEKVGRDWWLSPVTLLLGGKNKGWSGATASTTSNGGRRLDLRRSSSWVFGRMHGRSGCPYNPAERSHCTGAICDVPGPSSTGTKHLVERLTGGGGVKHKPRPDLILTAEAIAVP